SFHCEQVSSNSIITYSRPQGGPLTGSTHAGGYFFRRAAFAPSLPRAVRVFAGRCATVRFRFAAAAAFLTFRRAAVRCFLLTIKATPENFGRLTPGSPAAAAGGTRGLQNVNTNAPPEELV